LPCCSRFRPASPTGRAPRSSPTRRSSDLAAGDRTAREALDLRRDARVLIFGSEGDTDPALYEKLVGRSADAVRAGRTDGEQATGDRKSTRLNSSHVKISYAVFCLKKTRDA